MDIVVKPKDDSVSWEDLADLLHESFKERLDQGLRFTCSFMSAQDIERKCKDAVVLIALDKDNDNLLAGTVAFKKLTESRAEHFNLAVSPSYKHAGVATKLLKALTDLAIQNGCDHIVSDTADRATSSVAWHKKNGFYPVSLRSFGSTNYYSILFRKQLKRHWLWSSPAWCAMCFSLTSTIYKLFRNSDGSLTRLGKVISFFKRQS